MGEEEPQNNEHKKRQRKKRKNFISNAKKYAKKGQLGRGTKIPEELYQYFVGILDVIKQGVQDPDEREALVKNVLERTKDEEINVVGNQLGCRLVELLLPYASAEDLERFFDVLSPELRKLCSDNFSSHVVETLLRVSCVRATEHLQIDDEPVAKKQKTEEKYTEEHVTACREFTLKICKYALNNLEDFVWDQYANHILRSALKCLSGITLLPGEKPKVNLFKETVQDKKGIPPHLTEMTYKIVPDDFKEIVTEFANRLSSWPQFKDMPYQNLTSGLLQVLLYAAKNVDKKLTKSLVGKLLDESFAPDGWAGDGADEKKEDKKEDGAEASPLPPVFESESAVRLLEAALFVVKKKTYTQIYARCFINRLGQLAAMPMLNFTVQRLIDNCHIKEEFEPMFDELSDKFDALLACGNTGVLVALAKGCLRIKARQTQFLQNLEKALNCSDGENQKHFAIQCLRLAPLGGNIEVATQGFFIHIHGSVILQTLLDFQRPTKPVQSLLELQTESLLYIFSEAKGCHVADAFCKGQFVGVKARDKLIWKLKGCYQTLAMSQYGSRAFDKIYEAASDEQKIKIMAELSEKCNLLNSTACGRLIAAKLDVAAFKLSQKKWEQSHLKSDNKCE
ncbi:nucleolar protein 9 [Zerene cesonia]|uniref:nucleolar protein 9 n=1 Tax=Zerene cesonia TaxID=33412 RepID=UPI0018E576B5|nr:nucleolar protein 9 [Zerene cesonia]